jgi:hypothetical protein
MRANLPRSATLDDVLTELAATDTPLDPAAVRAWVEAYPQFRREIVDLATDMAEMEALADLGEEPIQDADIALIVNRTMSQVQQVLDAEERAREIADLATDLRMAGETMGSLEQALGIDRSMMAALIGGYIRPATIPARLVAGLSDRLSRGLDEVRGALRRGPVAQPAMKAVTGPRLQQVDFADLLDDADLTPEARERWRREPPDPALQGQADG